MIQVYCPKCFGVHAALQNMEEFILAPLSDETGVVVRCPDCGASFLVEITFYSLNPEDEGKPYNG